VKRRHFLATTTLALTGCERRGALSHIQGDFVGINLLRGHQFRDTASWPAPAITHRTRVLVAGGGVAGLAAARGLRLRGIDDFALLELEDSAGGNSRGGAVQGIPCPLGAHYLPVPNNPAFEVQDLLTALGLAQRVAGRWALNAAGERHLCHSPQERLYFNGQWQTGLLPVDGVGPSTLTQYQQFAQAVAEVQKTESFHIPTSKSNYPLVYKAFDAITFDDWLVQQGLTDPHLRWYLDYCCRDDYGAGSATVSAWAGIHYFASRHGFHAPGDAQPPQDQGVLTWPEGNAWLTQRLAAPLGQRLHTGCMVTRIEVGRHGVEVDAFNALTHRTERWLADSCIVALPLFIAARVLRNPPPALVQAAAQLRYAPWLVANLYLSAPLHDHPGAPPSWDNVIYTPNQATSAASSGLGYVDARHQSLTPLPGPTVLTHYRSFGTHPAQRQALYQQPWRYWRDTLLAELSVPHPDIAALTTQIDLVRYGHAMTVPVPGVRSNAALAALASPPPTTAPQRLHFAHSDLSGYSIFEEAFTHGHRVGSTLKTP
jgi:predicted NAD/FAD-binding protein